MPIVQFSIAIDPEQYLAYYQGRVKNVSVVSIDGRRIEFPAERLRPYLSHNGIHGHFEIEFDAQNRFVALRQRG